MNWYDLNEQERITQVFSKHTIQDFWNWWSNNEEKFMEVRIKDIDVIKDVYTKYKLPYSSSGVYVNNAADLKKVIAYARDKTTVWFGINPRKKNWSKLGFKVFGGRDVNVSEISHIFVDIDRITKDDKPATKEDLKNADELANRILEKLNEEGWSKSYVKICSGNGVQLLIKLDFPIKLPEVEYNSEHDKFYEDAEFEKSKNIIRNGIGQMILNYGNSFSEELKVEVDKACLNIGRVGALPVTKNYKYGGYTWRGIIELKDEVNEGLTDYAQSRYNDIQKYNSKRKVFKASKSLLSEDRLIPGKIEEHKLCKFMLETTFPDGGINNTLWFMLKALLRDSNIDLQSDEFLEFHRKLKHKHNRTFTLNLPDDKVKFDPNVINMYCIKHMIEPIYDLWPTHNKSMGYDIKGLEWNYKDLVVERTVLSSMTDIFQDMKLVQPKLRKGDKLHNYNLLGAFMNGCVDKYGEEKAKFYFDIMFEKFFDYE